MSLPELEQLEGLDGAHVLVRLDLNVPLGDGRVKDDTRVQAALPTVQWLLDAGARVALCSHLGKAKGSPDPAFSLAPVGAVLAEALGTSVPFATDCLDGDRHQRLEDAPVLLLENLRFHAGEKANDPAFGAALAAGFTHYVNDAFGTAHRAHASVTDVANRYGAGHKAAGRLMGREVAALRRAVENPAQPFVAVVGGAKVSTKTEPLRALLSRVRRLIIGGGMANTFFKAKGLQIGRSLVEDDMLETATAVMERAASKGIELLLPTDVVVAEAIQDAQDVQVVPVDAVPADRLIVDMGPDSRRRAAEALRDAQTVFWNGPMGVFEQPEFAAGTLAVAEAMAACDGFTVVGGGESVLAVKQAGVDTAIDHVSTGGGASLKFITGEPLPAIVALEV
jgi:phosphoglycerate kinase